MKTAVVTRADENISNYTSFTIPLFKKYCKRIGSDFVVLDHEPPILTEDGRTHYRILRGYDLLDDYDRLLFLDADMILNKNCPNIFDVVPEDSIGTIFEDVGTRKHNRLIHIIQIQRVWGNVGWTSGYSNAGTFVVSKMHRDIFLPYNNKLWTGWGSADLHLSYQARRLGFKFFELDYKWNHMTMFSEDWNRNADRFNSHIIHYAGNGRFDSSRFGTKLEQMKFDFGKIYG